MFDTFLVPEKTVVTASGDGETIDLGSAQSRIFLLLLKITNAVEQESIELSVFGSTDGQTWEAKPLATFPSTIVLCLRAAVIAESYRAIRNEIRPRTLGLKPLGARLRNTDVRVQRESNRGCSRNSTLIEFFNYLTARCDA